MSGIEGFPNEVPEAGLSPDELSSGEAALMIAKFTTGQLGAGELRFPFYATEAGRLGIHISQETADTIGNSPKSE